MEAASSSKKKGLLVVYTGDGKGKTTAALGMVFRALGRGLKVSVIQFIKGRWKTGEQLMAARLEGLDWKVMGRGFTWESEDLELDKQAAQQAWQEASGVLSGGTADLLVLDELTYTFQLGFLDLDQVLDSLKKRPPAMHVVITGRGAPAALLEAADLVTEMNPIKHPFQQGVAAQPGVDY